MLSGFPSRITQYMRTWLNLSAISWGIHWTFNPNPSTGFDKCGRNALRGSEWKQRRLMSDFQCRNRITQPQIHTTYTTQHKTNKLRFSQWLWFLPEQSACTMATFVRFATEFQRTLDPNSTAGFHKCTNNTLRKLRVNRTTQLNDHQRRRLGVTSSAEIKTLNY